MAEYYMLNKPRGCITARRDPRHRTVMDCFPDDKRDVLFPIGRLDRDTEGLLLVTDDGALCARLLTPENKVEKEYFFYALGSLTDDLREQIEQGIKLYPTKEYISSPAAISIHGEAALADIRSFLSPEELKKANRRPNTPVFYGTVTVTEGKKHQVKRMLLFGGCKIVYLKRIRMGNLSLDESLATGEYRPLTESELLSL